MGFALEQANCQFVSSSAKVTYLSVNSKENAYLFCKWHIGDASPCEKNAGLMIYYGFMLLCVVGFCVNKNVQKNNPSQ